MKTLLLCAGEGTRFRPWTLTTPKPAIPFMGVPMLSFPLAWADELGKMDLSVNVHHLPEKIRQTFERPELRHRLPRYSDESSMLMGSGGALKFAQDHLRSNGQFLVMNGDEVFVPRRSGQLREAFNEHCRSGALVTFLTMKHPLAGTKFGAIWADSSGRVCDFGKSSAQSEAQPWHFIGSYFAREEIVDLIPPDRPSNILYDVLIHQIQNSDLRVHEVEGLWNETGNIADYLTAHELMKKTLISEKEDPHARKFLIDLLFTEVTQQQMQINGENLLIQPRQTRNDDFSFEGFVILGHGSRPPTGARLRNVVVGENISPERIGTETENSLILKDS